jgi:1-acyl-sn-glycerol-3-phosphate acyltransferase
MALEAGVAVIPVAMIGTFEVQPQGKVIPRVKRIGMRFGAPLDFSRYAGLEDDRFVLRSMTDEIMYELMLLSNQEYVDIYAAKAKADLAAARKVSPPPSPTPPPASPPPDEHNPEPTREAA